LSLSLETDVTVNLTSFARVQTHNKSQAKQEGKVPRKDWGQKRGSNSSKGRG